MENKSGMKLYDHTEAQCILGNQISDGIKLKGRFDVTCYRDGKLIWTDRTHNIVTTEGYNRALDVMFHATTQITVWYSGLVETNTTPAITMTYATPVFTESTAYDEATRPEWIEGAASAGSMTNAAAMVFTISSTKTMYGAALFGGGSAASTKGNTLGAGALYCFALFSAGRAVVDNDIINVTYTLTAADDAV